MANSEEEFIRLSPDNRGNYQDSKSSAPPRNKRKRDRLPDQTQEHEAWKKAVKKQKREEKAARLPTKNEESAKREENNAVEEVKSEKKTKRKKKRHSISDHIDFDEEHGLNKRIAQMDGHMLVDYIAAKSKRFEPDLTTVELEERYIPGRFDPLRTCAPIADEISQQLQSLTPLRGRSLEPSNWPRTFWSTLVERIS
jgi:U3-containing 90S pre-ribosomal complex subunit